MPAHNRIWRHERQVLAPAGTELASERPKQLVPGTESRTRSRPSGTSQNGELVAQEQILKDEVLPRASYGSQRVEQEPEEFEHVLSIADL
jgi:hypothetical protein